MCQGEKIDTCALGVALQCKRASIIVIDIPQSCTKVTHFLFFILTFHTWSVLVHASAHGQCSVLHTVGPRFLQYKYSLHSHLSTLPETLQHSFAITPSYLTLHHVKRFLLVASVCSPCSPAPR